MTPLLQVALGCILIAGGQAFDIAKRDSQVERQTVEIQIPYYIQQSQINLKLATELSMQASYERQAHGTKSEQYVYLTTEANTFYSEYYQSNYALDRSLNAWREAGDRERMYYVAALSAYSVGGALVFTGIIRELMKVENVEVRPSPRLDGGVIAWNHKF